ncbi:MAG: antitermination protein [Rhizobium sp.]|nr:antitermination protein [Rhizobium sp.]
MRPNRFVQNFSQRRALILTGDVRAADAVSSTARKLGLSVEHLSTFDSDAQLGLQSADARRDVLFIDGDMNFVPEFAMRNAAELAQVPVVGLVGVEAPSRLRALMQIGATAFLSKPVHSGSMFSALYLAVNEYEQRTQLRLSIEELERRRRYRRHVIKAVTMVMTSHSLDDEGAFALLRKESMRARVSLENYCEGVVQRSTAHLGHDAEPDEKQVAADSIRHSLHGE